jgi:hypothetical protein
MGGLLGQGDSWDKATGGAGGKNTHHSLLTTHYSLLTHIGKGIFQSQGSKGG